MFRLAKKQSNKIETIKKIECLLIEKYLSIEKDSIKPVIPNDNIKIKLILSIEIHHFYIVHYKRNPFLINILKSLPLSSKFLY